MLLLRRWWAGGGCCPLSLSVAALILQLLLMLITAFLVLRGRGDGTPYGQLYNTDAGDKLCVERPGARLPRHQPTEPLLLAPCQSQGHYTDNSQRFRMDSAGRLLSQEERCVGSDLRLHVCRGQQHMWVFTQGSGLVHVESSLCLTRDLGSRLTLRSCDNRAEQYWWYQLEGREPPV